MDDQVARPIPETTPLKSEALSNSPDGAVDEAALERAALEQIAAMEKAELEEQAAELERVALEQIAAMEKAELEEQAAALEEGGTETSDKPLAETKAEPRQEVSPVRGKRGIRRVLGRLAIGTLALGIGIAINMAAGLSKGKHARGENRSEGVTEEITLESKADRIDLAIRTGRFADVLMLIHKPEDSHRNTGDERSGYEDEEDTHLLYREALALEGLRQWPEAGKIYHYIAEIETGAAWARAVLGEVRCEIVGGELPRARELLSQVLLVSGGIEFVGANLLPECLALRGRIGVYALGKQPGVNPLDDRAIAWPPFNPRVDLYLDWLPEHNPAEKNGHSENGDHSASSQHPQPTKDLEVIRYRWVPNYVDLTAKLPKAPLHDHFKRIAAALGRKLVVSSGAISILASAKEVAIDVERAPLEEVLSSLADRAGLNWRNDGNRLEIVFSKNADKEAAILNASRELRRGIAGAEEHPTAVSMQLELANLDYLSGSHRIAGDGFRRFLTRNPNVPEALHAAYNLGLIELENGNFEMARDFFVDVIDRKGSTKWDELGSWWIARSYLDSWEIENARKTFEKSRTASSKDVSLAATLALCAIDLHNGDNTEPRSLLAATHIPNQKAIFGPAEWFSAWILFRNKPTESHANDLVEAVEAGKEGRAFGPFGSYLAGLAYREAGQPNRTARVFEAALATARGSLAYRMSYELAEHQFQLDRRARARQLYLAVAASDPESFGAKAELRLAEIALRDGLGNECIRRCRNALRLTGLGEKEICPVMGKGFELMGQYRLAAECFEGRIPR